MITVKGREKVHFGQENYPPCPEYWKSTFVPSVGMSQVDVMVIGEAPGKNENKQGLPFVGAAGKWLDILMNGVGIERSDCYITNVIKYQPPGNNISTLTAHDQIKANIPMLIKEIKTVKPKVIVPMGNVALHALGYSHKIGKARGTVFESQLGKIIPTYHPAALFRQWHELYTAQKDWEKIAKHTKQIGQTRYREDFEISPSIEDLEEFVYFVTNLVNSGQKVKIAVDLETYIADSPLLTPIKLIGIAISETRAIVVPFINQSDQYYWPTKGEAVRAIKAVGTLLENPQIEKLFFNGLFDVLVLMNHGFTVTPPFFDPMLGQTLIYHLSQHSLAYVTSIYTDFPAWKLTVGEGDKEYREYNARDCVVLHMIYDDILKDINDNGLTFIFNVLMDEMLPVVKMMLNGIYIDKEKYAHVRELLEAEMKEVTERVSKVAGFDINLESTRHVSNLLFKRLKLRSQVNTKGGAKSTSRDVINRLANRYPDNKTVHDILTYRTISTRYKTFIKNLLIQPDNRVHSSFKMHRVVTGRFSSSEPNMQNLPKRADSEGFIRGMYVAPPGRKIITADYSQLELMIFAEISHDEIWQEAFRNGEDVHKVNGDALLGEYQEKYRTFVKNFIYGFIYGSEGGEVEKVAPRELIEKISVPQMMNNLKQTHPWLFQYRHTIERQMRENNYVTNAFGRRRWFIEKQDKEQLRQAYNFPIQSTAGDIMNIKMSEVDKALKWPEEKIILQLHDAFYLEVPDARVKHCARMLKEIMEESVYSPMGYEFNLKVEVEVGTSLSDKDMERWSEE